MKKKGAIFDLDGTILDSMWVWDEVDSKFLGERGFSVPEDYQQKIAAMGFRETAQYTIERFGILEKVEDIIQEWNEMARRLYHEQVKIKPFVEETLRQLKKQGFKLGVATASSASLYEECLRRNHIYEYFDAFTETQEVERGKGFPDIYIKAAKKIGCESAECIVFEDIHQGILAAKQGGFFTVGVHDEKSAYSWESIQRDSDCSILGFEQLLSNKEYCGKVFGMNLDVF